MVFLHTISTGRYPPATPLLVPPFRSSPGHRPQPLLCHRVHIPLVSSNMHDCRQPYRVHRHYCVLLVLFLLLLIIIVSIVSSECFRKFHWIEWATPTFWRSWYLLILQKMNDRCCQDTCSLTLSSVLYGANGGCGHGGFYGACCLFQGREKRCGEISRVCVCVCVCVSGEVFLWWCEV